MSSKYSMIVALWPHHAMKPMMLIRDVDTARLVRPQAASTPPAGAILLAARVAGLGERRVRPRARETTRRMAAADGPRRLARRIGGAVALDIGHAFNAAPSASAVGLNEVGGCRAALVPRGARGTRTEAARVAAALRSSMGIRNGGPASAPAEVLPADESLARRPRSAALALDRIHNDGTADVRVTSPDQRLVISVVVVVTSTFSSSALVTSDSGAQGRTP